MPAILTSSRGSHRPSGRDRSASYETEYAPLGSLNRERFAISTYPSGANPVAQRDAEVGFKVFGTMGIRDYSGAPRQPIFDHWALARTLPLAP